MISAMHTLVEVRKHLGRVLLLTGSIGSGHTRAAQALQQAVMRGDRCSGAEVVDVIAHAQALFRLSYRDAYIALIERAPSVIGWIYRSSDTTRGGEIRRAIQRLALARMRQRIRTDQPDTIVCTHFLAAELVSGMIARGEWQGRFGVVVTDLDAHGMWAACPHADCWFVAIDETVEILVGHGVARDRICVTGIPIMGAFAAPLPSRAAIRTSLNLPVDAPMLLMSGGGVGVAMLADTLAQVLSMDLDCGVALVCGKNEVLREAANRIVSQQSSASRVRCTVLGHTDRMHELMSAADLAIGKPGGLTTCEALASGLPMAIVNPLPGQEERNSDHLLEWGVAVRLNSPMTIGWRLRALLTDRERLAAMRARALARAKPFAADAIVSELQRDTLNASSDGITAANSELTAAQSR